MEEFIIDFIKKGSYKYVPIDNTNLNDIYSLFKNDELVANETDIYYLYCSVYYSIEKDIYKAKYYFNKSALLGNRIAINNLNYYFQDSEKMELRKILIQQDINNLIYGRELLVCYADKQQFSNKYDCSKMLETCMVFYLEKHDIVSAKKCSELMLEFDGWSHLLILINHIKDPEDYDRYTKILVTKDTTYLKNLHQLASLEKLEEYYSYCLDNSAYITNISLSSELLINLYINKNELTKAEKYGLICRNKLHFVSSKYDIVVIFEHYIKTKQIDQLLKYLDIVLKEDLIIDISFNKKLKEDDYERVCLLYLTYRKDYSVSRNLLMYYCNNNTWNKIVDHIEYFRDNLIKCCIGKKYNLFCTFKDIYLKNKKIKQEIKKLIN